MATEPFLEMAARLIPSKLLLGKIERTRNDTSPSTRYMFLEYAIFEHSIPEKIAQRACKRNTRNRRRGQNGFSCRVDLRTAQRLAGYKHVRLVIANRIQGFEPYDGAAYDLGFDAKDERDTLDWQRNDFVAPRPRCRYAWMGISHMDDGEISGHARSLMERFKMGKGYNVLYKSCKDFALLLGYMIMDKNGWSCVCAYRISSKVEMLSNLILLEAVTSHLIKLGPRIKSGARGFGCRFGAASLVAADRNGRQLAWLEDFESNGYMEEEVVAEEEEEEMPSPFEGAGVNVLGIAGGFSEIAVEEINAWQAQRMIF